MRRIMVTAMALGIVLAAASTAHATTILAGGEPFGAEKVLPDVRHLWVSPADFERISGFKLKPEGACLGELCVPIRQNADNDLYVTRDGQHYLNATAFADKMQQAYAVDREQNVWSFGRAPATRKAFMESAVAPDFTLKDRKGNPVHLSDFRGKKVLILTWASW